MLGNVPGLSGKPQACKNQDGGVEHCKPLACAPSIHGEPLAMMLMRHSEPIPGSLKVTFLKGKAQKPLLSMMVVEHRMHERNLVCQCWGATPLCWLNYRRQ